MRSGRAPTASCSTLVCLHLCDDGPYASPCDDQLDHTEDLQVARLKSPCLCFRLAEQLISGKEDAANNFARGHYTIGKVSTRMYRH